MTARYSVAEARNRLAALIHEVEDGPPVELTRRGHPVAVLISLPAYERLQRRTSLWDAYTNVRRAHDFEALDLDAEEEIFEGVRGPSPGRAYEW